MPPLSRAAVIVPPVRDFYFTRHRFSSLGAHIVKMLLDRSGIATSFFNFPLMKPAGTPLPLPQELAYLKPYLIENETGGTSFFTRFKRFGPDTPACALTIAASRPDICFFSVFAFAYADDALELAGAVKKLLPGVPLVMGGAGPSCFPEYFLGGPVDYVLTGEAEVSIPAFLGELTLRHPNLDAVPNILWKKNGPVRRSSIHAAATGGDIEIIFRKTAETARVSTWSTHLSRGCPMGCAFCSSHCALGKRFRTPRIERLIEALETVAPGADAGHRKLLINIEDDNLLADERFAKAAIAAVKFRFPHAEIIMENGIDYRFLSPEKTEWLVRSGMKKFNLSLGSLDKSILQSSNRDCSFEQYEGILDVLASHRLPSVTYFICGFKEDTAETIAHGLRYLAKKNTAIGISPFYAVPGIAGFTDAAVFAGKPSSLCLGAACYPWNGSLSTETLVTAFRLARFVNASKYPGRTEIESRLVDRIRETGSLHTLIKERKSKTPRIVEVARQDQELVRLFFGSR